MYECLLISSVMYGQVDNMIEEGDLDVADGKITYEEFEQLMRGDAKRKVDIDRVQGLRT